MASREGPADRSDAAQGHFLALAELLREMNMIDLLGRLGEVYVEFMRARLVQERRG